MDCDHDPQEDTGLIPRGLAWAVGVIGRHPWFVLGLTVLSCLFCALYTWNNLTYLTHRNDLISNKKDYLKRWHQYVAEFGNDDDMVVVVEGGERAKMEKALDELAAEIEKRPDTFERLFYKVDLRPLHSRALLYLPTEQIRDVQHHLQGMSLLLEPPVLGTVFDKWIGWRNLSVHQLLRHGDRELAIWKSGERNPDAEQFFTQLALVCDAASDYLDSPASEPPALAGGGGAGDTASSPRLRGRLADTGAYRSPWRSVLPTHAQQEDRLATPQYFFSEDGKLAFLLASPVKDKDSDSFTDAQASIAAMREIVGRISDRHPDVHIGLTGLPVLENDEMTASQSDSNFASWLALVGVALLYLIVYRGFRYPLMTVSALVVGTIWALGWLTLTVGHLNILSSAFAVMLIGMGDYGILWVTRFGQERQAGFDIDQAMRHTAMSVGPSICTAAMATAFAFFAAMLADLRAVSELGWIAGCGILLCALSCFIVVPALLAIFDFRVHAAKSGDEMILSLQEHQEARREWLAWLMKKPRWVVIGCGILTLVLAGLALNIHYDHNLLNLQAQHMDSVLWEKKLIQHTTGSSWYAVSWTTTPEEALALKAKYEELPEVSNVITLASMIPPDQDRKMELLRDLQQRLSKLPARGEILERNPPNIYDIQRTCSFVLASLTKLQKEEPNETLARLQVSIGKFLQKIECKFAPEPTPAGDSEAWYRANMLEAHSKARREIVVKRSLNEFDQWMARDLADDLHRLRDVSTPTPIRLDDLPSCLRERYIGKNGKWLVRVFSKDCLWEFEPLARFIQQVRTVDPEATGKPFTTLEGLIAMRNGFLWAGVYALIAMVIVLFLDFGRLKHTLVALLPLAMGMIATLGFMALCGFALNPANMIAFPLILGVGADNGVHVLHDFKSRDRKKRYRLSHATGRGIMVAALTTILGFGTLMIAQHRGMASLGLILTVGVTCCMTTALVFLPALLYVMGKRDKSGDAVTLPMGESKAA